MGNVADIGDRTRTSVIRASLRALPWALSAALDGIGGVAPVGLAAHTLYTGIYATDTLDLTKRLSLNLGARYNFANIILTDELGNDSELNGNDTYTHFNPMIGATCKITPNLTLYGDYVIANRAPTPLELECSDPERPCLIDNALVGDPPSEASGDRHL
jgi:iron complex outermembrane recepter protein